MSRYRPHQGARLPLFDRLVDEAPAEPFEVRPKRFLDPAGLAESVQADVARLFNTQRPITQSALALPGTTLDYGIPDLVSRSPASSADRQVLCADLVTALKAFEPRLASPQVAIGSYDEERGRLTVKVKGVLTVGQVGEALSFTVDMDGLRRE